MARGGQAGQTAQTAATSAQNLSNTYGANSQALLGELAPELETEATAPSGYSPTDLAAMRTAGQQSAGGSQSAAVGQGSLLASRTRNAGGADAAIDSSARSAGRNLANTAVNTEVQNAGLKQRQQQAGLSGLEGLTNLETGGSINALGEVAPNVNANTNAANSSWDWATDLFDPILKAGSAGASPFLNAAAQGGGG